MLRVFTQVFTKPSYLVLAAVVTYIVFTLSVLLPNVGLVWQIITDSAYSIIEKLQFVWSLYGSIQTNFSIFSASYTILIAILFGINIALLVAYIRGQQKLSTGVMSNSSVGTSLGGIVSGFFGIGCAACGTFILSSVLTLFGAGALVTLLPLDGAEFGILGIGLLSYSIYALLKKMQHPNICKIN